MDYSYKKPLKEFRIKNKQLKEEEEEEEEEDGYFINHSNPKILRSL